MTLAFLAVWAIPVDLIGCLNRGLAALTIALASGLMGIFISLAGLRRGFQGDTDFRWIVSALILTVPVILMIILG